MQLENRILYQTTPLQPSPTGFCRTARLRRRAVWAWQGQILPTVRPSVLTTVAGKPVKGCISKLQAQRECRKRKAVWMRTHDKTPRRRRYAAYAMIQERKEHGIERYV